MKNAHAIDELCAALGASRSGYYAWCRRRLRPGPRAQADAALLPRIAEAHARSRGTYGSPRVTAELCAQAYPAGRHRVARLMRSAGLSGRRRGRYRPCTTDSAHAEPIAPNRRQDRPAPAGPDQVWVGDITSIPTDEGWDYLAVVLDAHTRRVVGQSSSEKIDARLVSAAFGQARTHRRPAPGLIFHSDRGVQYASKHYREKLTEAGTLASMSRTANPYDNAQAESFFSTLKTELVHRCRFRTRAEARAVLFEWIECFYNRRRRHSALGYLSPVDFENRNN
jgi:putative transposase